MSDISWIKLKTKMFDDEKIQLIEAMPEADAILVIWVKLLIQAGKTNANGFILLAENIPYSPEMLSTIFRRPLPIVKFALKIFSDLAMIEITDDNIICIANWEKHQNIEGLDKVREQNRLRQQKFREQKRLNSANNEIKDNVTVTPNNTTDKEEDKEIKNKNKEVGDVLLHWNNFAKQNSLSTIVKLSGKRINGIKSRLREKEFNLITIFDKIKNSPFLLGNNDRGWKIDFDFIFCSANNYLKILEGKYNGTGSNTKRRKDYIVPGETTAELKNLYEGRT